MSGSDLAYWMSWTLGLLLFAGCVAITWWGLFGDRARGRRRCPRCWYDLSHTPGLTCPECGFAAAAESQLHRSRRRLLPAAGAALVASLGAAWTIERAEQRGWATLLPTRAIMLALPLVGQAHLELTAELSGRLQRSELTGEQVADVLDRCLTGDPWARPVTVAWEHKYTVLLANAVRAAPETLEAEIEARLRALPARMELTSPRVWPRDAPVCLELDVRDWWPDDSRSRLRIRPEWEGGEPLTVLRVPRRRAPRPFPLIIERPPPSPLRFEVVLERPEDDDPDVWVPLQRQRFTVDVEVEGTLASTLQPVTDPEVERAVRATFGGGAVKWTDGRSPLRVFFNRRASYRLADPDLGVGARVEILRDGVLARRLDMWWTARAPAPGDTGAGWIVEFEDDRLVREANGDDGRWAMRVTGDPALALRAGDVSRYWDGAFTVPLRVEHRETTAPPKAWWILE